MTRVWWCKDDVYAAFEVFRDRCLNADGSLFSDRRVWTIHSLEAVDAQVSRSDPGSGSWLDKLVAQLETLSPEEVLLGGELVYMLLLPQLDTLAETKRAQLGRVLGLLDEPPALPSDLDAALDGGGIAKFSTAKSWSPTLLQFLIRLAVRVKEMSGDERRHALSDPWVFRDVVEDVRTSTDQMMANAIKHALFPETFESIISPSQREQLMAAFAKAPGVADQPNDDRKIGRIAEITAKAADGDFTLYEEPLRRAWSDAANPRWEEAIRLAQRIYQHDEFDALEREYKLIIGGLLADARNAMLAGDSTWPDKLAAAFRHTRQNLVNYRVHGRFLEWVTADRDAADAALRALWTEEPPTVPGFVRLLPPEPQLRGRGTRASIASFLLMGVDVHRFPFFRPTVNDKFRRALGLEPFEPDEENATEDVVVEALYRSWVGLMQEFRYRMLAAGTELRDPLDAQSLAWWLVSAYPPPGWTDDEVAALKAFADGRTSSDDPGTGPHVHGLLPPVDADAAAHLHVPVSWLNGVLDLLEEKKQIILYGPPGTGKTFIAQRLGKHLAAHGGGCRLVQFHPSYTYEDFFEGYRPRVEEDGVLRFELVPGALRTIAEEAKNHPSTPYLLIIDEINRGNIAKIFGELYFLLEYREEQIALQYSGGEPFALPPNLFLIGTMNTADRSIALVDTALRRRFYFVELSPTKPPIDGVLARWLDAHDHDREAADFLEALNAEIDDDEFAIGPSYFMSRNGATPNLDRIWANAIMPLLQERYHGTDVDLGRFTLEALRARLEADAD
jgi:5-methylcytosine-specific restriction protein B